MFSERQLLNTSRCFSHTPTYEEGWELFQEKKFENFIVEKKRIQKQSFTEDDFRSYEVPLCELFKLAQKKHPLVSINKNVMGGAPCIAGTRIPVYIILEMLVYEGSLKKVLKAYQGLTTKQIEDAIHFASTVLECSLEHSS